MLGAVNEKALHELGWRQLCAELAARSRTPMGRERTQSLLPHSDPEAARSQLALVEEARLLRRHERELPLADAVDVRPSLGRDLDDLGIGAQSNLANQIARIGNLANAALGADPVLP
jgi:dsDNA-specific endonuclease/ATPase MutS2